MFHQCSCALLLVVLVTSVNSDLVSHIVSEEYADFWLIRLIMNLMGYATLVVPGYLFVRYFQRIKYDQQGKVGCMRKAITMCVFGNPQEKSALAEAGELESTPSLKKERTFAQNALLLSFCVVGLQVSYLTWGLLQERIMAHKYTSESNMEGETFKNSQFLVFINRVLSLAIGFLVLQVTRQPDHVGPVYKYSYCSFSNVMSSWFQYEALKFVSFPTQVLCKASKVIPVMLMGKVVSKKTYENYEYITAAMLSAGIALFLFSDHDANPKNDHKTATVTTYSGVILMIGYMAFDSFTSNWQGALFSQYKMSSVQMMTGVNLFSCAFTSLSLIEQGSFFENFEFMTKYPTFLLHSCILSICSATGQLFIYYTISQFGPVTFTIIMTVRMALAILLSCYIYSHTVGLLGIMGIIIVFISLFAKIYAGQRMKALRRAQLAAGTVSK